MKMIRMILADDEPVIIRGIRRLLDWNMMGIEIVGEYEDGRGALEAIVRDKPDIALLDISMPGMSGVEILKECRAMGNQASVIFISGFQDFEYAKAALKYGAVEYLLKPVIREELLRAIEKAIFRVRGGKEAGRLPEKEERDGTINYELLIQNEDTGYVPVYADIVYNMTDNEQIKKLIHFSLFSFLEEYLGETGMGIVFQKNDKIVMVLKGMEQEEIRREVETVWAKSLKATGHTTFFVMGDMVFSMSEIPAMFENCLQRGGYLFFADKMPVPVIDLHERVFAGRADSDMLEELRQRLYDAIVGQNEEQMREAGRSYGRLVLRLSEGKKEDACFYFCTAVRFVEKPKEYIDRHYMENLSLNVLAEEIHMNPYYFSSFFKKNTGENFKDYVNRIRIENALPMLLNADMKTYEIAQKVGFGDIRVFNAAFQKIYLETPGSYRKRVRGKE